MHQVMEVVRQEKWREVGNELPVPPSILDKIDAECSSDGEKMSAVVNYVVTIIPDITWEGIAAALYMEDEEKAVERVKPYLHIIPGRPCFNILYTDTASYIFTVLPGPASIIKCTWE